MTFLTDKEKLTIYKNTHKGPYSAISTHDTIDELMEDMLGEGNFTGDKMQITTTQLQMMLGVIFALKKRIVNNKISK